MTDDMTYNLLSNPFVQEKLKSRGYDAMYVAGHRAHLMLLEVSPVADVNTRAINQATGRDNQTYLQFTALQAQPNGKYSYISVLFGISKAGETTLTTVTSIINDLEPQPEWNEHRQIWEKLIVKTEKFYAENPPADKVAHRN